MNTYAHRNKILKRMGFNSYTDYLKSDLWKVIRRLAFATLGTQCYHCGQRAEMIHHGSYSWAVLSGKTTVGLLPICERCHHDAEFDKSGHKRSFEEANDWLGFRSPRPHRGDRKKKHHSSVSRPSGRIGGPTSGGSKVHVGSIGQPCRKCGTPVVRKETRRKPKPGQLYGFKWYLYCPKCRTMYMMEEAKYSLVEVDDTAVDNVAPDVSHMTSIRLSPRMEKWKQEVNL